MRVRVVAGSCVLVGAAVVACGGIPGNAVATVDGEAIAKSDYAHWQTIFAKRKTPAKQLREQTLSTLIAFKWIEGEADKQGVAVSAAEVDKSFDQQKAQSFPRESDFQKFLRTSGQSTTDLKQQVRFGLLQTKLAEKVVRGKDTVTDKAVADFYAKNKARFAQPEKRGLRAVLTKTRAEAEQARTALAGGDSWKHVAKRFTIDDSTAGNGGKIAPQAKGTLDKTLDNAVFSAPARKLVGPVKTQFGYYVFTVTSVTRPAQQSLAEAKGAIQQTLQSQRRQQALDAFVKDFTSRWRAKTECRADYLTSQCRNGPKPTPTQTVA
jgi:foldase protein PrsA